MRLTSQINHLPQLLTYAGTAMIQIDKILLKSDALLNRICYFIMSDR